MTVAVAPAAAHRSSIRTSVASPGRAQARGGKFPWAAGAVRYVPGRIVVVWRPGASAQAARALSGRLGVVRMAPTPDLGVDVIRVPTGRSVAAAIRGFHRSPLVRFAEPDRIARIMAPPNDTDFTQQWSLDNTGQSHELTDQGLPGLVGSGTADADVDAPEAWAAQSVHDPSIVAVIDTGVDVSHPDLANRLWVNTAEQAGTGGVDDDGNGFVDDVHGWDFAGHDANPVPANGSLDESHGTHLAGIIAAEQNNAVGISGVCPDCQVMALRIGSSASLSLGNELKAIDYAIANGADIINLSLGSPLWSAAERAAIAKAGKAGILVVVAAGNASADNDIQFYPDLKHGAWAPSYPATYSLTNILSVAASNDRDQYGYVSQCRGSLPLWECGFTSWGHDSVDVAAPGVDILSTVAVGKGPAGHPDYAVLDGTSMAAPLVAGIAGLVLSEHPGDSAIQVKNAIMHSVQHPASLKLYDAWQKPLHLGAKLLAGRFTRTQGRVNALNALTASTANATPKSDGNVDGARSLGRSRSGSVSWPGDANDVFRERLVKGRRYRVTLDGPRRSDMDLWVWKPGTKEVFQFTPGCFKRGGACPALEAVSAGKGADEQVTFKAPKTGVFFVQVNGWYSGGHYTLRARRV
jgi:subtilisin family serine protease